MTECYGNVETLPCFVKLFQTLNLMQIDLKHSFFHIHTQRKTNSSHTSDL